MSLNELDWRGINWPRAASFRLLKRDTQIIPYWRARLRLDGEIDGGGRLEIGWRWPDRGFRLTEFILREGARCSVAGRFRIHTGCDVVVESGAHLDLHSGGFAYGGTIICHREITIGVRASIAPGVVIRDGDSHGISGASGDSAQPIHIGDYVWIGTRAMILKGVTIGDGAVIAAGSIVNKDVESGMLVAGVPAKPIRPVSWDPDFVT
jgi:acetyltransferase-like isoleucine patch superfamily enzyme